MPNAGVRWKPHTVAEKPALAGYAVKHASDRPGGLNPEARIGYPESSFENFCNKLGRCIDYYIDGERQTPYIAFGYRAAA